MGTKPGLAAGMTSVPVCSGMRASMRSFGVMPNQFQAGYWSWNDARVVAHVWVYERGRSLQSKLPVIASEVLCVDVSHMC